MKKRLEKITTFIQTRKKIFVFGGVLITIGLVSYFLYDYYSAKSELSEYKDSSELSAIKERTKLLEKITKYVKVPEDEEPTIATVTNAFRLRGQTFFAQSENGDKVVIYPKAGRAILYRPSIDRVIEAAPVNITDIEGSVSGGTQMQQAQNNRGSEVAGVQNTKESTQSASDSPAQDQTDPEDTAKIAIYNGTITMQGVAGKLANYLLGYFEEGEIEVTELSNADESFEETLVINNTKKFNNLTVKLTELLGAKETNLPDSEDIPKNVDILIILGKDIKDSELDIF